MDCDSALFWAAGLPCIKKNCAQNSLLTRPVHTQNSLLCPVIEASLALRCVFLFSELSATMSKRVLSDISPNCDAREKSRRVAIEAGDAQGPAGVNTAGRILERLRAAQLPALPFATRKPLTSNSNAENFQEFLIDANGKVWAKGAEVCGWCGGVPYGTLGFTAIADRPAFAVVPRLAQKHVKALAFQETAVLAITDQELYVWGAGQNGALGDGTSCSVQLEPTLILQLQPGNGVFVQVGGCSRRGLAVTSMGQLYTWGMRHWGCGHPVGADGGAATWHDDICRPTIPEPALALDVVFAAFVTGRGFPWFLVAVTRTGEAYRCEGTAPWVRVELDAEMLLRAALAPRGLGELL